MNPQVKPLEKKTNKILSPTPTSLSSLPHEITENCLARISKLHYPKLSTVSNSFRSLLTSRELYAARARLGSAEECLCVCLWNPSRQISQWFTLWISPNSTLTEKTTRHMLVPMPSSYSTFLQPIIVGSKTYVVGGYGAPSSVVRVLDYRSHTWKDAPSMNVPRSYASACVYEGKIYVLGGVKEEESSYAEVFDVEAQTWERLPDPPSAVRNSRFIQISEDEGKIYVTDYAYDVKQGKWECCNGRIAIAPESRSKCVMENISYCYCVFDGISRLCWFDIEDEEWKIVKGLDTLVAYNRSLDSLCSCPKLVSLSGKLFAIWEKSTMGLTVTDRKKKIWCAEIEVEKRVGSEISGKVKWVDVVHTAPFRCYLLHCLAGLL